MSTNIDPKRPLRVHVLYETSDRKTPHGCSHIRLLRPLSHPSLAGRIEMQADVDLPSNAVDLLIFERLWTRDFDIFFLEDLLQRLSWRNIPFIHTFDDNMLLVDEPPYSNRALSWTLMRKAAGLIVSTTPLADAVRRFNPTVEVVGNHLDERLFHEADKTPRPGADAGKVVFGYMGTFSHLEDLLMIIGPLRRVLYRHEGRAVLEVVGVADPELVRGLFPGLDVRVRQVPDNEVDYPAFAKWMQRGLHWDFAVAPLRDNSFTRYKSDLKILDYGVLGIPGIFSDMPVYNATLEHNKTGLLAANDAPSWEQALELLINDAPLRRRLGGAVKNYVWSERMLERNAAHWADAIETIYRDWKNDPA